VAVLVRAIPVEGCLTDVSTHICRPDETVAELFDWADKDMETCVPIRLEITKAT